MGRDNHNAGLHLRSKNYRVAYDTIDEKDKYAEIIANRTKKDLREKPYAEIKCLNIKKDFFYRIPIVEKGDTVVVNLMEEDDKIEIHTSDVDNPFMRKKLNEIVVVKGEKYKIVDIKKERE